jgi:hypothetical protein
MRVCVYVHVHAYAVRVQVSAFTCICMLIYIYIYMYILYCSQKNLRVLRYYGILTSIHTCIHTCSEKSKTLADAEISGQLMLMIQAHQ